MAAKTKGFTNVLMKGAKAAPMLIGGGIAANFLQNSNMLNFIPENMRSYAPVVVSLYVAGMEGAVGDIGKGMLAVAGTDTATKFIPGLSGIDDDVLEGLAEEVLAGVDEVLSDDLDDDYEDDGDEFEEDIYGDEDDYEYDEDDEDDEDEF